MRVFLDTNVLVSAFAGRGLCTDLLQHVLAEHDLIVVEVVIAELRRVLHERMKVPAPTIAAIEELLREQVVVPKPDKPHRLPKRDPDDQWVLASAIAGRAAVLVTGDADLLDIGSRIPLRIVTPREFWEMSRDEASRE